MAESASHEISFVANPTQRAFIEHRADNGQQVVDLFSCRMGEGKSCALIWSSFFHTQHNPGARWALIRDTWENCRDTTQVEFFKWFKPGVMGTYKAADKTFTWSIQDMRGSVTFMGMDDEKDAAKLQSRELAGFGMDEPSPAAGTGGIAEMVFSTALTRFRQSGMKWYAAKLAQNNPDESHWTYKRFVDPGTPGYVEFKTVAAENLSNLPLNYYETMKKNLAGRDDLQRRFILGEYGYQQEGRPVTPNWSDRLHLADHVTPVPGTDLAILWDFGLNPTCIITQVTPLGHWLVCESFVGDGIGAYELISDLVKPAMETRYSHHNWAHIGDPAGVQREQSSSLQSAVKVIKKQLGGRWTSGAKDLAPRINPLNSVLSRTVNGIAVVQVDRRRAKEVHHALRGGWHYAVGPGGVPSTSPRKNDHSHPGDAMSYGASRLFPLGQLRGKSKKVFEIPGAPRFFGGKRVFIGRPGLQMPENGATVKD